MLVDIAVSTVVEILASDTEVVDGDGVVSLVLNTEVDGAQVLSLELNTDVVDGATVVSTSSIVDVALAERVVLASNTVEVLLGGIELVILLTELDELLDAQTSTSASLEMRAFIGGSVIEHSVSWLMLFTPSNESRV